ncbi:MAG TPA: transglycosylase SLT domain-containing protein [Burkholderiaceae bacterium]|jgi:hypothetical protein
MRVGPGIRIRHADRPDLGTLACILRPRDPNNPARYLLSAAHVLNPGGYADLGDLIQGDGGPEGWVTIAKLADWTIINSLSDEGLEIDAAIAELLPEFADQWRAAGQAVAPRGVAPSCYPGMALRVYGAETEQLMDATLQSSGDEILVDYRVENSGLPFFAMKVREQIFYGRNRDGWHSVTQGGDSGALVTNESGYAVGLHIGGTNANAGIDVSVCTPIQKILDRFSLVLDLGVGTEPAPLSPADSLSSVAMEGMGVRITPLLASHNFNDGVSWQLTPRGVMVAGDLPRTGGQPVTATKVWAQYGAQICQSAIDYQVPVELIVATICTESHGNPAAIRVEPDGRTSVGLMQTLIGTAQYVMRDQSIDADGLRDPTRSIEAGTACIANERRNSGFDPPLVAAIYNAGSLRQAFDNRWRFAQYVGPQTHVDSYVAWFNDCFAAFEAAPPSLPRQAPSFWKLLKGDMP